MLKEPTVERFNGKNFFTWRFSAEMEFRRLESWDLIEDFDNRPSLEQKKLYTSWKRRDDKAMGHLVSWLDKSQIVYVRNHKHVRHMWDSLCSACNVSGFAWTVELLKQLFWTRKSKETSMQAHCAHMMTIVQQLKDLNCHPADNIIIAALFVSVGESYSHLIVSLDTTMKASQLSAQSAAIDSPSIDIPANPVGIASPLNLGMFSIPWIIQNLIGAEARQGRFDMPHLPSAPSAGPSGEALVSRHTVICHKCGVKGHYKSECPSAHSSSKFKEFEEYLKWKRLKGKGKEVANAADGEGEWWQTGEEKAGVKNEAF